MENHVSFETFTWKIENFTQQNTKNLRSKAFKIGDHQWRIRLYPLRRDVNHFSLYLMVAGSLPAYGWSRNTYFKLVLINQFDGNKSIVKETHQKFNGGYRSWGSSFLNLNDFYDPKQGYLVKNACIVETRVCVSEIPLTRIKSSISSSNGSKSGVVQDAGQTEFSEPEAEDQETESSNGSDTLSTATWGSSRTESESQDYSDLTLKDILDLDKLASEEEGSVFIPLLEEACTWHPSLIRSQRNRSERFKLWAFTSLGQVLHFLKTTKVKDMRMNEEGCKNLQVLWEELVKSSGFNLTWLEPYVQSALGLKAHLERTMEVNGLRENLAAMETKMNRLRRDLSAVEAEFEVARREFDEARKGLLELDLNAELGYSMF